MLSSINWVNRFEDGFDEVFGARATLARHVVDAGIRHWERVITDFNYSDGSNAYSLVVQMSATDSGLGASAAFDDDDTDANGRPKSGGMTILRGDNGAGGGYFLDPTPEDSSEFSEVLNAFVGRATSGDALGSDLYSIVVHELGHALGFLNLTSFSYAEDTEIEVDGGMFQVWRSPSARALLYNYSGGVHVSGPYPPANPALGISYDGETFHGALDFMNAVISPGQRYLISDRVSRILADGYGYSITAPQQFGTMYASLATTGELEVRGGAGASDDQISIYLDGFDVVVSVDLGQDVPGTGPLPGTMDQPAFVSRFKYWDVNSLVVDAGAGNDDIVVDLTLNSIAVLAGPGEDAVVVSTERSVDTLVDGGDDRDVITLNNADSIESFVATNTHVNGGRGNDQITIGKVGQLTRAVVIGEEGEDDIEIGRLVANAQLNVQGDTGSDRIAVGGGNFVDNILGEISVDGGIGADTLTIDDRDDVARLFTIPGPFGDLVAGVRDVYEIDITTFQKTEQRFVFGAPVTRSPVLSYTRMSTVIVEGSGLAGPEIPEGSSRFFVRGARPNARIELRGNDGVDTFEVEAAGLDDGADVVIRGGAPVGTPNGDTLHLRGTGAESASYLPGSSTHDSRITVGSRSIEFSGLEPVHAEGFSAFSFVTPRSRDVIDVRERSVGGESWTEFSGTSGVLNTAFEALRVQDIGTLTAVFNAFDLIPEPPIGAFDPTDLVTIHANALSGNRVGRLRLFMGIGADRLIDRTLEGSRATTILERQFLTHVDYVATGVAARVELGSLRAFDAAGELIHEVQGTGPGRMILADPQPHVVFQREDAEVTLAEAPDGRQLLQSSHSELSWEFQTTVTGQAALELAGNSRVSIIAILTLGPLQILGDTGISRTTIENGRLSGPPSQGLVDVRGFGEEDTLVFLNRADSNTPGIFEFDLTGPDIHINVCNLPTLPMFFCPALDVHIERMQSGARPIVEFVGGGSEADSVRVAVADSDPIAPGPLPESPVRTDFIELLKLVGPDLLLSPLEGGGTRAESRTSTRVVRVDSDESVREVVLDAQTDVPASQRTIKIAYSELNAVQSLSIDATRAIELLVQPRREGIIAVLTPIREDVTPTRATTTVGAWTVEGDPYTQTTLVGSDISSRLSGIFDGEISRTLRTTGSESSFDLSQATFLGQVSLNSVLAGNGANNLVALSVTNTNIADDFTFNVIGQDSNSQCTIVMNLADVSIAANANFDSNVQTNGCNTVYLEANSNVVSTNALSLNTTINADGGVTHIYSSSSDDQTFNEQQANLAVLACSPIDNNACQPNDFLRINEAKSLIQEAWNTTGQPRNSGEDVRQQLILNGSADRITVVASDNTAGGTNVSANVSGNLLIVPQGNVQANVPALNGTGISAFGPLGLCTVTNTHDSGPGTLRAAIDCANQAPANATAVVAFAIDEISPVFAEDYGTGSSTKLVAADATGNSYVLGFAPGTLDLDGNPAREFLVPRGYFLAKYDPAGALLWEVHQWSGTLAFNAIEVDDSGNVLLGGQYLDAVDLDPGAGVHTTTTAASSAFVLKLDSAGELIWVRTQQSHDPAGTGRAGVGVRDLAMDAQGNVYVAGTFLSGVQFAEDADRREFVNSDAWRDSYVAQYDAQGNLVWVNDLQNATANHLDVSRDGQVYTAGLIGAYFDIPANDTVADFDAANQYADNRDILIASRVSNWTRRDATDVFLLRNRPDGSFDWVRQWGAEFSEIVTDLEVDADGSITIAGAFNAPAWELVWGDATFSWGPAMQPLLGSANDTVDFDPGPAEQLLTATSVDAEDFVLRLDREGEFLWARSIGSDRSILGLDPHGSRQATPSLELDENGGIVVARTVSRRTAVGDAGTIVLDPRLGGLSYTRQGFSDLFLLGIDPAGSLLWSDSIAGAGATVFSPDLAQDGGGNVYLTGSVQGTADLDPGSGTRLQTDGSFFLKLTFNHATDVDAHLLGGDPQGDVFVISPLSALPALARGNTVINGQSQQNLTGDSNLFGPEIVVAGQQAGLANGLELRSSGNRIHALNIQGFGEDGIYISGNDNAVTGSYLGTNGTGTAGAAELPGVVGWWPGEHTANDIAGDYDGTLAGGTSFAPGIVGQAFRIDGVDDSVTTPLVVDYTAGVTFELWVQTTDTTHSALMAGGGGATASRGMGLFIEPGGMLLFMGTKQTPGTPNFQIFPGPFVADGDFHHVAGTWTGDTTPDGVKLYVDGMLFGTTTALTSIDTDGTPLFLGDHPNFYFPLTGLIDEPAVYGRVLSASEIASIHGRGSAGKATSPANGGSGVHVVNGGGNRIGGMSSSERNVISGNAQHGVHIVGNGTTALPPTDYTCRDPNTGATIECPVVPGNAILLGNTVQGNYLGTTADGMRGLGNALNGVSVEGSAKNVIRGNVASGNTGGISIFGPSSRENLVAGNIVGLAVDGRTQVGNLNGVSVVGDYGFQQGAPANTIGGITAQDRNVIAGNTYDQVFLGASLGTTVQGNYIGTDASGTELIAYGQVGVRVQDDLDSVIGGVAPGAGNVISGSFYGIYVNGQWLPGGTQRLTIQGNRIGTDASGQAVLANFQGIYLDGYEGSDQRFEAHDVLVGGAEPGAGNLISGNQNGGVIVRGPNLTGIRIQGNRIGTDIDGIDALSNGHGVLLDSVSGVLVGGAEPGARNIISGNALYGVVIGNNATGNRLQGNYIGTNADGLASIPNAIGVAISAPDNFIGGGEAGAGNLISGNRLTGVELGSEATSTRIQGNFIGTTASGSAALGNGYVGVHLTLGAHSNVIGTDGDGILDGGERNVISGNAGAGVYVSSPDSHSNVVAGNIVGLDVAGQALGNLQEGIVLAGPFNIVGGLLPVQRNIIGGNSQAGIQIENAGAHDNRIIGNYIGTDFDGSSARPNGWQTGDANEGGVLIAHAANNIIGGIEPGARNIISANSGNGVSILFSESRGNQVLGNFIGTTADGMGRLGNEFNGVHIESGIENEVGGAAEGAGNVIAGNHNNGVAIEGGSGNRLDGNLIGLRAGGQSALGNGGDGVLIFLSRDNSLCRNVISGNVSSGVYVAGNGSTGNLLVDNRVGTSADGSLDLGNLVMGVFLLEGTANTVRGNLISGNDNYGVAVAAGSNRHLIEDNLIGTDAAGQAAVGNTYGLSIAGSDNLVRGNVISGNLNDGVLIDGQNSADGRGSDNLLQRNLIGLSTTGATALGRQTDGVELRGGAQNNRIVDNVISGNERGLQLSDVATTNNYVLGNKFGTDAAGMARVPNGDSVVIVHASGNWIGGSNAGEGNLISGSARFAIESSSQSGNTIQGNFIGTNANGQLNPAVWNAHGIHLYSDVGTLVGGTQSGAGNVIVGGGWGIWLGGLDGPTRGTRVYGNTVSGNAWGIHAEGGTGHRVQDVQVGDGVPGAGNVIAWNAEEGVAIVGTGALGITVRGNSIHDNGKLGIDLGRDGVTLNDYDADGLLPVEHDLDDGPNLLQNFPTLTAALSAGTYRITGQLKSAANTTFVVDFYASPAADPADYRQGVRWVGTTTVTTNGDGEAGITATVSAFVVGELISATATDPAGNTSEFSQAVVVRGVGGGGGGRPLVAESLPVKPTAEALLAEQLDPIVREALARWQVIGVRFPAHRQIEVGIADLPDDLLGLASGNTIWLDVNAAGWGWFVDATPADDAEFILGGDQGEQDRMDLLTVVMHELGHLIGHDHANEGVMRETLATGTRESLDPVPDHDWLLAMQAALAELIDPFATAKRRRS